MPADLIVAPEAELDIAEAYVWYEGRRVGLGEEFVSSVEASVEGIRRWPGMYAVVYGDYRRSLVRRFPYPLRCVLRIRRGDGYDLCGVS